MEKKADHVLKGQDIKKTENSKLYLLEIQEMEQKRISNELHDTTVQNLTMLIHKAELCEQLVESDIIGTKLELQVMKETLRKTIQELRNIIYNLRPMSVDDLGLIKTIERFIEQKEFEDDSIKMLFKVTGEEPQELKPIITMTIFRIIQELYNNAKKHSQCKHFKVAITFLNEKIKIKVSDDGIGFDSEQLSLNRKNFGLLIMKERVSLLSGEIKINTEKGKGTNVLIQIPIEREG